MKKFRAGKQRRNVGAGAKGEALEECCLLDFSAYISTQHKDTIVHGWLGPPTPVIDYEYPPQI